MRWVLAFSSDTIDERFLSEEYIASTLKSEFKLGWNLRQLPAVTLPWLSSSAFFNHSAVMGMLCL